MYTREQIEQHIWDYIDGLSTPGEKAMVERLLHADPLWKSIYQELSSLNTALGEADIMEQPSMRFTRNVMEEVAKYKVAKPASAYINKNIIYGIAAFFGLTFIILIGWAFTQISFTAGGQSAPLMDISKWDLDPGKYLTRSVINIFLFFDVIAGLMLLDRYLRRKNLRNAEMR